MDDLVSTDWLARNLGESDVAVIDSSAFLPTDNRDPNETGTRYQFRANFL